MHVDVYAEDERDQREQQAQQRAECDRGHNAQEGADGQFHEGDFEVETRSLIYSELLGLAPPPAAFPGEVRPSPRQAPSAAEADPAERIYQHRIDRANVEGGRQHRGPKLTLQPDAGGGGTARIG